MEGVREEVMSIIACLQRREKRINGNRIKEECLVLCRRRYMMRMRRAERVRG